MSAVDVDKDRRPPPSLAFVVPCFNEEAALSNLLASLAEISSGLKQSGAIRGEPTVVLVDDGSSDRTWALIEEASRTSNVLGLKLSRNYGQQPALLAGLLTAREDVVISLDADLQDDPGAIPRMVESYAEGAEIVYAVRGERGVDTFFKRVSAVAYYRLLAMMGANIIHNHADFRLLSRKVLTALADHQEVNLFLRGLIPSLGFPSSIVTYSRGERTEGESKYDLRRMAALAIEGITSFSVRPIRYVTVAGFGIAMIAFLYACYAIIAQIAGQTVPGWASTVVPLFMLGGIQLIAIGLIGEYVGKIYLEVKGRPRFIIETRTDGSDSA